MTTVVWDGKTLAADTNGTAGSESFRFTKIWKIQTAALNPKKKKEEVLFGGCGNIELIHVVRDWFIDDCPPETKPNFYELNESEDIVFGGMIVKKDGTIYLLEKFLKAFPIQNKAYAIGSGAEYALGALACGADAKTGVKIASVYDSGTNSVIEELKF